MDSNQKDVQNLKHSTKDSQKPPKFQKVIEGAYDLSLGISIIVAIALGFALGFGLKKLFSYEWLLWLGIFWGICAAISNIYKAYKRQKKALDELAKNPRYNSQAFLKKQKQWDKEDDED
ncbi:AtpZ/AtpI family protein [Helicobacter himalayensis]|uniref:AtpZ/AtpI family protein n=1 Tax=Helicobacter himalayensis TaxID=1591088 RepID=UPI003D6E0A46